MIDMTENNVGKIHLKNKDETIVIPDLKDYTIEVSGWITVEKNGSAYHYPPNRIDHIEIETL